MCDAIFRVARRQKSLTLRCLVVRFSRGYTLLTVPYAKPMETYYVLTPEHWSWKKVVVLPLGKISVTET